VINLRTFLDASADHLPQRFYDPTLVSLTGAHHTEVGMLLWVPDDPEGCKGDGGTDDDNAPEIIELRRFARKAGAAYVFLDRDADHVPGLRTYIEADEDEIDEMANDGRLTALARTMAVDAGADWPSLNGDAQDAWHERAIEHLRSAGQPTEACGRCGAEFPAGESCSGPGYHP
jgi:hypothetical protein